MITWQEWTSERVVEALRAKNGRVRDTFGQAVYEAYRAAPATGNGVSVCGWTFAASEIEAMARALNETGAPLIAPASTEPPKPPAPKLDPYQTAPRDRIVKALDALGVTHAMQTRTLADLVAVGASVLGNEEARARDRAPLLAELRAAVAEARPPKGA